MWPMTQVKIQTLFLPGMIESSYTDPRKSILWGNYSESQLSRTPLKVCMTSALLLQEPPYTSKSFVSSFSRSLPVPKTGVTNPFGTVVSIRTVRRRFWTTCNLSGPLEKFQDHGPGKGSEGQTKYTKPYTDSVVLHVNPWGRHLTFEVLPF